ncbi:MAG: LytTR family DNA-binding domain-containing protein [Bacteroidota bacterium]|nr:LytTR family DNA-binding domain-containing protein [Bacteroidota bacterium]
MSLRCVVVDDEPLAITIIEGFLKKIPYIEVVGRFDSALPVFEFLKENKVDLIFLDVEMPGLTGVDFVKTLSDPPSIIFITANKNYAIEGFDLNVDDFLLKPISFERLLKSINRIIEKKGVEKGRSDEKEFLYLKENKKMVKVYLKNILYLESIKDYVKVVTVCKTVVTKQPLSYFESILSASHFLRIHRSFIVAINKIDAYSLSGIDIGNTELPIGRKYKDSVIEKLDQISKGEGAQ